MGGCVSVNSLPQILILGLDGAGKTTFLYADKWDSFEPTLGFVYEEIKLRGIAKVGIWDLSGKNTLRCLWSSLYKNINFSSIVFVVDADKPDRFPEARRELQILFNEEELREAAFLVIFNTRLQENYDIKEFSSRIGLDLAHPLIKLKTIIADLMQEDENFNNAMQWLSEQLDL